MTACQACPVVTACRAAMRPLAAVLPDLLAAAWDEGGDFVTRHPGMSAEYVRWANPYRKPEGNRA